MTTTAKTSELVIDISEQICTLTLQRPQLANALNFDLLEALRHTLGELRCSGDFRVCILTGAGEKAFCAGADLKERATLPPEQVRRFIATIREVTDRLADFPKPVIAAINGLALGGGTELALACDIRIAADTALLGLTETSLGIIPGGGGTQRLPRLVGKGRAKELIFTARRIAAAEAAEIGLIEKVVPSAELAQQSRQLARNIAQNAPLALEMAKWAINYGYETDLLTGLQLESRAYDVIIPTKDRLEGLAAFQQKRKPIYRGE
ncbi:MAG: enoyl-CoA hydratase [Cyanobacteria bacterium NC_groundwater_1444_Ag_S-0.65um_54_12]|nr:enoyl-CoA hydratase [Cyanobacteria bacterium NC_groundwater_1444_Ag_S-0.65um_54_12]